MKKIFLSLMTIAAFSLFIVSCKKSDDNSGGSNPAVPTASFTVVVAGLKATFTNSSTNTKSYSWNFGDGSAASTETSPEHTYAAGGTYSVVLTVTGNDNSTKTSTKDVTVTAPVVAGPNLVQGGDMADESKWTRFPIFTGVDVVFAGGAATWSGGKIDPAGGGHYGIYQSFNVEAGKNYQLDMHVKGGNISNTWFEAYVGKAVPTAGVDYIDGGKRLSLNTWDCGNPAGSFKLSPFDAQLSIVSCTTAAWNNITFTTGGTVYLMIRCGGDDLTLTGGTGVTIDNVDFHSTN